MLHQCCLSFTLGSNGGSNELLVLSAQGVVNISVISANTLKGCLPGAVIKGLQVRCCCMGTYLKKLLYQWRSRLCGTSRVP